MIHEAIVQFDYNSFFPNMTENEYLNLSNGGPDSDEFDKIVDIFYDIDEELLQSLLNSKGNKIKVLDVVADFSGVEIPLLTLDIAYESETELSDQDFLDVVIPYINKKR